MYIFAEYANQCNTPPKVKLLTDITYLLTYSLTYFMRDVRNPGFWARMPAGYDSNVYLEYSIMLYFT